MNKLFDLFWAANIILESLPVSSSGHMSLILSRNKISISESTFHFMHWPNAIIIFFFILQNWFFLLYDFSKHLDQIFYIGFLVFLTSLITAGFYFLFKFIENKFSLVLGFCITSLLLLSLYFVSSGNSEITIKQAVIIGIVQGISLLPGISRMASTYVCGRWLGLDHQTSFLFSCTIELPILVAGVIRAAHGEQAKRVEPYERWMLVLASLISYLLLLALYNYPNLMIYFGYYMFFPIIISIYSKKLESQ